MDQTFEPARVRLHLESVILDLGAQLRLAQLTEDAGERRAILRQVRFLENAVAALRPLVDEEVRTRDLDGAGAPAAAGSASSP